jgi:hypothetical protein
MNIWYHSIGGERLGSFSGSPEEVKKLFVEINRNFILDLRIFTLQAFFIERIALVNQGVGVCSEAEAL